MTASSPVSVAASDRVVLTELGDGTGVLLHLDTKFYFTLNKTGVFVWKQLEQSAASAESLAETVSKHFEVDSATALSDVKALLVEMRNESLLGDA